VNDNDNQKVKRIKGPTIRLFGGTYFDYLDPEGSEFTIEDVAHALSNICRFGGHSNFHYSVAQHSFLASHIVKPEYAYDALMHDAPEAFIGDMLKPLKIMLPDYRAVENKVEAAVFRRFGVTNPLPEAVKLADLQMLVAEQAQVMGAQDDHWDLTFNAKAAPVLIHSWPIWYAEEQFLLRYKSLVSRRQTAIAA
jgi:hypothetical protein